MGGFFGGLATSVGDQLDQAHKEGEAKKKELRDAYFKVWSDPNVSDAVRQDAWENLNKHVNPDAKKGLAKIAPIFGKLAGHGKQAPGQQGDQPQQQGAPPQQAPQPQGSPGEQAMAGAPSATPQQAPSAPPPQQAQAAAAQDPPAAPQPQRAASPGARAMQGPGMGQAYGADYGSRQREQVQTAADAAEARKLKTFGAEEGIRAATAKTQLQEKSTQFWQDSDKTMAKVSEIMADPKLSPEEKHAKAAVLGVNLPNPSPPEDVKNIPGDKLGAQKDAFGNAVDPKGVYTRGKDGKFYPEAPPPKADTGTKFTGALGEMVQAKTALASKDSTPEQKAAAKDYLRNQELAQQAKVITINNAADAGKDVPDDELRELAQYDLKGGGPPNFGMGKSKMRERYLHIKADEIAKAGGGDSAMAQKAQFKADSASLTNLTKVRDTMKAGENGTVAEIDRLIKLSKDVPRSDLKLFNKADQFFNSNLTSHPELARYREALLAARYRYNSMIASLKGGGASTNQVRSETADEIIDRTMSQGTLEAAANEMKVGIANVMKGVDSAVDETKKRLRSGVLTAPGENGAAGGPGKDVLKRDGEKVKPKTAEELMKKLTGK